MIQQKKNLRLITFLVNSGRDINNYMRSGKLLIEKANENKESFLVNKLIE